MSERNSILRQLFVFAVLSAVIFSSLAFSRRASAGSAAPLKEDQKILHVLNRLGFGPAPGDIEKVRAIGWKQYIEQQLDPGKIDDSAMEAKLRRLDVTRMSTSEIFAKYPNPGAVLQMLEGGRNAAQPPAPPANGDSDEAMNAERQARRQKLAKIYAENGLRPANRIMFEVETSRILRAAYSERQLQEVMVDFWANHFNVFSGKAATRWYIPSYERDVLRKNALGSFKDLLLGTARHPAMLFYLDNFQSVAPQENPRGNNGGLLQRALRNGKLDPRVRQRMRDRGLTDEQIDRRIQMAQGAAQRQNQRGINENYARELMELHTLGVDGGYTQKDIQEVARAFTGWTIYDPRGLRSVAEVFGGEGGQREARQARLLGVPASTEPGSFVFVDRLHDKGAKTVLGHKIDAGGVKDGEEVIDILVSNPSTAKFIARKLAVKFVSDNPSEALVSHVAKAFSDSKGDIKSTLRALFYDPEFFGPENYRAKIKTPFELLVSSLRALDVKTEGSRALIGMLRQMGEPLYGYQAPTGYPDTAADWVNTGALLERMNFAVALASGRVPQTRIDLKRFAAEDRKQVLAKAIDGILAGEIANSTRSLLEKQMDQPLPEVKLAEPVEAMEAPDDIGAMDGPERLRRLRDQAGMRLGAPKGDPEVFKAVGLILGSPEFQRQ